MASQRLSRDTTPHEIVDATGKRVGFFANKSAAARSLNRMKREWTGGWRPVLSLGQTQADADRQDPFTYRLRPALRLY